MPTRFGRSVCVLRARNLMCRSVCLLQYLEKSVQIVEIVVADLSHAY